MNHILIKQTPTSAKNFEYKYTNDKKYHTSRDHCHYTGKYIGAAYSICNLNYSIPKLIAADFYNGPTYGYHFIIKEVAKEFESEFNCLREITKKCKPFSVPIT